MNAGQLYRVGFAASEGLERGLYRGNLLVDFS
jgi:hypothetical protein